MTEQQIGLISLVRSALCGCSCALPADFDIDSAFRTAKIHGITALAYYGACACGIDKSSPAMKEAFGAVCKCIMADERQRAELSRLTGEFDSRNIRYMALKGINLKPLYPHPEMRMMGDADILISTDQYKDTVRPLMLELGYAEGVESDHELIWNKPSLHVELHKRLIPSYNKDYYEYFGDGWALAKIKKAETECYTMTDEDELIYLFTHFAKHYRDSGIGIRHMTDIWVFRSAHPSFNKQYVLNELEKLKLDKFYENINKTLAVWFEGGVADEMTDFITDHIFGSGQYGSKDTGVVSSALKESKSDLNANEIKRNRVFRSVFPSRDVLLPSYPILEKLPILLPFVWVVHFVRRLFTKNKLKNYVRSMKQIDDTKISDYQRDLNYVGLDFNFK